jgi:hypothetical protein
MADASPIRQFISWAHQDGVRQEKLGHPLASLWREGLILAKSALNWRNGDGAVLSLARGSWDLAKMGAEPQTTWLPLAGPLRWRPHTFQLAE